MKMTNNAQTEIRKPGNEQKNGNRLFPHGRFWTGVAVGVTALALPFFLKTCGPKTEPLIVKFAQETHKCGECHPDTLRVPGVKGAPDTLFISSSAHKEQGCDSLKKETYNEDCGCKKVEKKATIRKTVIKTIPQPLVEECMECPGTIANAGSDGAGVKAYIRDKISAVAGQLRADLVNSDPSKSLTIYVILDVNADGLLTAQKLTPWSPGDFKTNVNVARFAGINVLTENDGAPMKVDPPGKPCMWKFSIAVPQ